MLIHTPDAFNCLGFCRLENGEWLEKSETKCGGWMLKQPLHSAIQTFHIVRLLTGTLSLKSLLGDKDRSLSLVGNLDGWKNLIFLFLLSYLKIKANFWSIDFFLHVITGSLSYPQS